MSRPIKDSDLGITTGSALTTPILEDSKDSNISAGLNNSKTAINLLSAMDSVTAKLSMTTAAIVAGDSILYSLDTLATGSLPNMLDVATFAGCDLVHQVFMRDWLMKMMEGSTVQTPLMRILAKRSLDTIGKAAGLYAGKWFMGQNPSIMGSLIKVAADIEAPKAIVQILASTYPE